MIDPKQLQKTAADWYNGEADEKDLQRVAIDYALAALRERSSDSKMIAVYFDTQPDRVIDRVNMLLAPRGLRLVDDGKEHDGFIEYALAEIK